MTVISFNCLRNSLSSRLRFFRSFTVKKKKFWREHLNARNLNLNFVVNKIRLENMPPVKIRQNDFLLEMEPNG